ncbi:hypothetical protein J7438_24660 [Thalassotalea sp. G20_0]|uniref:hypothetical protein n=1 Tax=Thalassotalea sp. G20_0 TaxID=2821093 RepID=UPI001ADAD3C2|nr:hypothetical protein [Thalassotalea sp. G20_0]MBO9497251.1 hypothetical protein [Thalassotalea sp. G20_0]
MPSAKVESPLLDQYGGYTGKTMVATSASNRSISCRFVHISGNQSRTYLQRGVLPGTLTLSLDGGTFEDNGAGSLLHKIGTNNYSKLTVDYVSGRLTSGERAVIQRPQPMPPISQRWRLPVLQSVGLSRSLTRTEVSITP